MEPGPTILVIEDHNETRRLLERALETEGYNVIGASRALEGLDIARSHVPDLILTDINLPDLSGLELTTTLRSDPRFTYTPIVAMSVAGAQEQRELVAAAGVNGFIEKPLRLEAIALQLEFFLSGGTEDVADTDRLEAARARYTQDIVARLEQQIRELEEKNAALEELDRMKDAFIQITAHELRTPLNLINGYSGLLEGSPTLQRAMRADSELSQLIDGLTDSIGRMQNVVEEIITVSRIMTNQMDLNLRPVNLAQLIRQVLEQYQAALRERRLQVEFNPREWALKIQADAELLRIVFANLISNAMKHTPDGGRIALTARANRQYVRLSVRDTGVGIPPEEQPYLFTRYRIRHDAEQHGTSKTAFGGQGLGLGLAICKGIVDAHQGKIAVESPGYDPQRLPGSEFAVILPISMRRPGGIRQLSRRHTDDTD